MRNVLHCKVAFLQYFTVKITVIFSCFTKTKFSIWIIFYKMTFFNEF